MAQRRPVITEESRRRDTNTPTPRKRKKDTIREYKNDACVEKRSVTRKVTAIALRQRLLLLLYTYKVLQTPQPHPLPCRPHQIQRDPRTICGLFQTTKYATSLLHFIPLLLVGEQNKQTTHHNTVRYSIAYSGALWSAMCIGESNQKSYSVISSGVAFLVLIVGSDVSLSVLISLLVIATCATVSCLSVRLCPRVSACLPVVVLSQSSSTDTHSGNVKYTSLSSRCQYFFRDITIFLFSGDNNPHTITPVRPLLFPIMRKNGAISDMSC